MVGEAQIIDPAQLRMRAQPVGQRMGVLVVPLDPQRQRFQALQQQEAVERRLRRTQITQALDPGADDVGDVAEVTALAKGLPEI